MFCCSSCVSNVKEDDLIKGRLVNLDTVPHAVWTHVVSYDPTPSTADVVLGRWWRSESFNHSMMDTKVVEFSAEPFWAI